MADSYELTGEWNSTLLSDLREVWREYIAYHELLFQFALRDIRIRYKQAVMGFGWAIFMPALIVLSGMIVRFAMAKLSGGAVDGGDMAGIAVRALPWAFFVGAIGFSNMVLIGNHNLVTKIYFPREVLPVASVLAQGFDSTVGLVALTAVLPFLGAKLTVHLIWLPLLVLLLVLITIGLALFLSAANLFFRDVKYLVQVVLTFGIFFTPVFYEPEMLGVTGSRIAMLNPLAPVLEGIRIVVVEGQTLATSIYSSDGALIWAPWALAYSGFGAVIGLLVASVMFHRLERLFAEYV